MENWAEIRRLHRAEAVPIKEIARRLGIARNTVRAALAADSPPKYTRPARGSLVDAAEPRVPALLAEHPAMPATVIAERVAWPRSITTLKDRVRALRPLYAGLDPADRMVHHSGVSTQCDLWFSATPVPVGAGQVTDPGGALTAFPVLTMTLAYSRFICAVMLPSCQGGDLLAGMWQRIETLGAVTKTLTWDRGADIGGTGRLSDPAAGVALPAKAPTVGPTHRISLGRDDYVRIDGSDHSIDPSAISRFIDITATPTRVIATYPALTETSTGTGTGSTATPTAQPSPPRKRSTPSSTLWAPRPTRQRRWPVMTRCVRTGRGSSSVGSATTCRSRTGTSCTGA